MNKKCLVAALIVVALAFTAVLDVSGDSEVDGADITITFLNADGTKISTDALGLSSNPYTLTGPSMELPSSVTKPGYHVTGWYDNNSFVGNAVFQIQNKGTDLTFYGKWEKASYWVYYNEDHLTVKSGEKVIPKGGTVTIDDILLLSTNPGYEVTATENLSGPDMGLYHVTGAGHITITTDLKDLSLTFDPTKFPNLTINGVAQTTSPCTVVLTSKIETGELARGYAVDSYSGLDYNDTEKAYYPNGTVGDIKLNAKVIQYKLTYQNLLDNQVMLTEYYTVLEDHVLKTGKDDFAGYVTPDNIQWTYDMGGTQKVMNNKICSKTDTSFELGDKTVYATLAARTYQLSIDSNITVKLNDSSTEYTKKDSPLDITKGDKIYISVDTSKYGYNVSNLTQYGTGSNKYYKLSDAEAASITLAPIAFKVNLEMNGGTMDPSTSYTYTTVTGLTLPQDGISGVSIKKEGYTFRGWYDNQKCEGNSVTTIAVGDSGDKTFYAGWTPLKYTIDAGEHVIVKNKEIVIKPTPETAFTIDEVKGITISPEPGYEIDHGASQGITYDSVKQVYVIDGKSTDVVIKVKVVYYTILIQYDKMDPRDDVIFVYKNDETDPAISGTTKVHVADDMHMVLDGHYNVVLTNITAITDDPDNIIYRANGGGDPIFTVSPKPFKITFDPEYLEVKKGSTTVTSGSNVTVEDVLTIKSLKEGHELDLSKSTHIEVGLKDDEYVPTGEGNVELKTKLSEYDIYYNFNDQKASWKDETKIKKKYTKDDEFNLPTADDVTLPGYTFEGWYAKSDLSGSKVLKVSRGTMGELEFYAKWTPNTITVTMILDGAQYGDKFQVLYNSQYGISLVTPEKSGYAFVAWELSNGTKVYQSSIVTVPTDHEVFAKMSQELFLVQYNPQEVIVYKGGSEEPVGPGNKVPKGTQLSYVFTPGYTLNPEATRGVDSENIVDGSGNVTIVAKLDSYYVNIDENIESVKFKSGAVITPTPDSGSPQGTIVKLDDVIMVTFKKGYVIDQHTGTEMISINEFRVNGSNYITLDNGKRAINFTAKEQEETAFQIYYNEDGTDKKFIKVSKNVLGTFVEIESESMIFKGDLLKFELEAGYELDIASTGSIKLSDKENKIYAATGGDIHCISAKTKYMINYVLDIEAYWESGYTPVNTYTITDSVVFDTATTAEPKIKRDGYVFKGWFTDRALTSPIGFISVGSQGDMTLYPKWAAKDITVTYKYADDPLDGTSFVKKYGTLYGNLASPTVVVGTQFVGWCLLDPSIPENEEFLEANMVDAETVLLTPDDHNLYAVTKADVKVTVYYAGYEDTMTIMYDSVEGETKVLSGSKVPINTLLSIQFEPGYGLAEGYTGIEVLKSGYYLTVGPIEAHLASEKIDYYVVSWAGIKDIKFNGVSVSSSTVVHVGDELVVTYQDKYVIDTYIAVSTDDEETFTVNGIGFYLMNDGRKAVAFSAKPLDSNYYVLKYSGHITDAKKYNPDTKEYEHIDSGSKVNVNDKIMFGFDEGYELDVESTGNIRLELGKDDVYRPIGGNIDCVSKPIQYSISYVLGATDASWDKDAKPVYKYTIETETFELSTKVSRPGTVFDGWEDSDKKAVTSIAKGTTGDKIFYATWDANDITITYHCSLDADLDKTTFQVGYGSPYGSSDGGLATPFVENQKFLGWYTTDNPAEQDERTLVTSATLMKNSEDHGIYAKFEAQKYLVRYEGAHITEVLFKGEKVTDDTLVTLNDVLELSFEDGYSVDNHIGTDQADEYTYVVNGKQYALLKDGRKAVYFTAKDKEVETRVEIKEVEKIVEVERSYQVNVNLDGGAANNLPEGWYEYDECVYTKYFLAGTPIEEVMAEWSGADIYKSGYALAGWESRDGYNCTDVTIKYGDQQLIVLLAGAACAVLVVLAAVFITRYERS